MKRKIAGLALGCLLLVEVANARNNAALLGAAALITGAAIVASSQSAPPPPPGYYDEPRPYYKKPVQITPDRKIQQSLTNMGFYQGKIDGKLNTYASRTAIKALNTQYGISEMSSLDAKTRDQLLYLADLYQMDKDLFAEGNSRTTRGKRLQTALTIHGTYFDKIDGVVGNGTRKAIVVYKRQQGLTPSTSLSPSDTDELIKSAQEMNTKAIDEAITNLSPKQPTAQSPSEIHRDGQVQNNTVETPSTSQESGSTQEMPELPSQAGENRSSDTASETAVEPTAQEQDAPVTSGFE